MSYNRWRIYFNKKEDFPCIWSVDEGSSLSEVRVQWVSVSGLTTYTACHPGLAAPSGVDPKNEPSAWLEINGCSARFANGGVIFEASE